MECDDCGVDPKQPALQLGTGQQQQQQAERTEQHSSGEGEGLARCTSPIMPAGPPLIWAAARGFRRPDDCVYCTGFARGAHERAKRLLGC